MKYRVYVEALVYENTLDVELDAATFGISIDSDYIDDVRVEELNVKTETME